MPKEKASKRVNCDIRFDNNPNGIFKAGDTASGSISLTLAQPKKVRGMFSSSSIQLYYAVCFSF